MSIIVTLLGLLGLAAVGVCVWQHRRYLKARREIVQDQQPLLYSWRTFHAVIYLKVAPGKDVIGAVRVGGDQHHRRRGQVRRGSGDEDGLAEGAVHGPRGGALRGGGGRSRSEPEGGAHLARG